jgi:drug/metabolite transporter (DMT)-like permease
MNPRPSVPSHAKPPAWKIGLALAVLYLAWGTTYLAIREGVQELPPGLFGGLRVLAAGVLVLAWLRLRGLPHRVPLRQGLWLWLVGGILFVGGNGLITLGEKTVPSGVASVLAATTPLWMAVLEVSLPLGERLTGRGWAGLLLGLAGVVVLMSSRLSESAGEPLRWFGPALVLTSAACWGLGAVLNRHRRVAGDHLVIAAWQMTLGGGSMALIGLLCGEAQVIGALDYFPFRGLLAFLYLLLVGSLIGFLTFTWLLGHVPAVLAGTHSYVNPVVAILIGWLLADEALTLPVVAGMVIILAGVALVRGPGVEKTVPAERTAAPSEPILASETNCCPVRGRVS